MKDIDFVIQRPLLTEKSVKLARQNKYTFRVHPSATKIDIRTAVEKGFGVKVLDVNTLRVRGKQRRMGRFKPGRTAAWKKAIVTLRAGDKIALFEGL